MSEITIQKGWLEGLLEHCKKTKAFMDTTLSHSERMTLLDAGVPELVGYCSSAEFILSALKEKK